MTFVSHIKVMIHTDILCFGVCLEPTERPLREQLTKKKVSAVPFISFDTSWRTMATFGIADY